MTQTDKPESPAQGEIAALRAALDKERDEHHKTQNEYYVLKAKFIKLQSKDILRMQSCQRIGESEQPQAEPDGYTLNGWCVYHDKLGFREATFDVDKEIAESFLERPSVYGWRVVPVKIVKLE